MNDTLQPLIHSLRCFAAERNWQQFHSPKNLACALSVEAAELLEHFQWLSEAESQMLSAGKIAAVRDELADVFIYLLQLADKLGVDLLAAAENKVAANEAKYPIEKAAGSSKKYRVVGNGVGRSIAARHPYRRQRLKRSVLGHQDGTAACTLYEVEDLARRFPEAHRML